MRAFPLLAVPATVLTLAAGLLTTPPTATALPSSVAVAAVAPAAEPATARTRAIGYRQFETDRHFRRGVRDGVRVDDGRVEMATPTQQRRIAGGRYDVSTWTSRWVSPGFAFDELIPSWSAITPGNSLVEVRVRGRSASGRVTSWDLMALWTSGDAHLRRTTASGQGDDLASVNVDTWQAPAGLTSWKVRVSLGRAAGTAAVPSIDTVGAVASRVPDAAPGTTSPGVASGSRSRVLDLPRYSQMVHRGHSPQWGGGGQAWCSPTSTSMVLGYYDALPRRSAYRWVGRGHTDPFVDHAARLTYDRDYGGTGNWPFNTAYAAPRAGKAFVTRLRGLREAERFVAAGIPLVASISFGNGELSGAPIGGTDGHLLVIVGFTRNGDVVVNDPAAQDRAGVRRTYDRGQLEDAWLEGSGGVVYVIREAGQALPGKSPGNW